MGAAILDRKSWGPPSWTGSDVKNAKVTPILLPFRPSLELFSFFKQLTGLIEENLDLGPTTNRQVLKSTYLHMSLPKIPTLEEHKRKKFALMPSNCVETFSC